MPSIVAWTLLGLGACQYDQGGGFRSDGPPPASILLHKQALGQDGSFNYAFAADNGLRQGEVINPDGSRKGSYSYVDPSGKTVTLSYTAGKDGFKVLDGDHLPKPPEPHLYQQKPNPHYYQQQQRQHPPPPPPITRQHQEYAPLPHQESLRRPLFRAEPVPYEAYKNAPNAPSYRGDPITRGEGFGYGPHPPPPPLPHHRYALESVPREPPHGQSHRAPPLPAAPLHPPRQYSVQEGSYENSSPYLPQQHRSDGGREDHRRPHSFGNGYAFEFSG